MCFKVISMKFIITNKYIFATLYTFKAKNQTKTHQKIILLFYILFLFIL